MGVPKFYGMWLRRQKFAGMYSRKLPRHVSGLYIDLNSLIHQACQMAYGYGQYEGTVSVGLLRKLGSVGAERRAFDILRDLIVELYKMVNPEDMIFLAVDGIAPQAKISQQRARRLAGHGGRRGYFDSNSISPGTPFMRHLDDYLNDWLGTGEYPSRQVYYSSHLVPGEGEHKIMNYIRGLEGGNHVVHGLDTDLIFLTILLPESLQVYLWRDISPGDRVGLDVNNLRRGLNELMMGSADNFVLLCMLLGNDFMPTEPSMRDFRTSIDTIVDAYLQAGVGDLLDEEYNIIWEKLLLVMEKLSQVEGDLLEVESRKSFALGSPALEYAREEGEFSLQRYRDYWYMRSGTPKAEDILQKSLYYLDMWQWTIKYYVYGHDGVNRCLYYPYYFAPLIEDLVWSLGAGIDQGYDFSRWVSNEDEIRSLHPYEALMVMLPPHSSENLPLELRTLSTGPLEHLFPKEFHTEYEGVNDEWLGINYIPLVDVADIVEFMDANPQLTCSINLDEWEGQDLLYEKITDEINISLD